MADVGYNSQPHISQESAQQSTPEGSCNPLTDGLAPDESVQTPQDETADNLEATVQTETRRLKSIVWDHFTKTKVNGEDKAQCNYCKKYLGGKSKNGTRHLHQHMGICVQRKISMRGNNSKGQTFLMPKALQGKQELGTGTYDAENARRELANAIIMHEYPLSIVDHLGFKRYSSALQPLFQVPSRNTIKKEIFNVYDSERSMTLKLLDSLEGKVAITSDMWTAGNQKRGYMAVTAHYIDGSWTLQSHILRFIYIPAPYTSDRLANALVECLMDWNIDTKLSTVTLDNCSTNDAMINKVKDKLQLNTLLRDGSLLHMCCCAHILNLIVKDGLEVVKDGIEKIRDSVGYWTATPKRKEKFEETAKQLRVPCTKNLVLDCPTRWNSTYTMLVVAILYQDIFSRLKQRESQYTCLPTSSQWKFAKVVCDKLEVFNSITEIFSGTKYPTSNLYFPKICEIKLEISKWIDDPDKLIKQMAEKTSEKFDKYWSVIHDIMGVATVLDPRFKMDMLEYYYEKLYPLDTYEEIKKVQQLCYDLVSDYQLKMNQDTSSGSPMLDASSVAGDGLKDYDAYIMRKKRAKTSFVKTELDHYLEEDVLPRSPDFDILMWWKLNDIKYPTLQAIAKDVLAIPVSTVASESAFSTSGHILSPHCSRLHWTTLEALMCTRSWLWSAENTGGSNTKVSNDFTSLLNEIESDDEGEMASGVVVLFEEDR